MGPSHAGERKREEDEGGAQGGPRGSGGERTGRRGGRRGRLEARHENSLPNRLRTSAIREPRPTERPTDRSTDRSTNSSPRGPRPPLGPQARAIDGQASASSPPPPPSPRVVLPECAPLTNAHSARKPVFGGVSGQGLSDSLRDETGGPAKREREPRRRNSQGRAKARARRGDSLSAVLLLDLPAERAARPFNARGNDALESCAGKYGEKT